METSDADVAWNILDEFNEPFFLSHAAMNFHGGKVLFGEKFA